MSVFEIVNIRKDPENVYTEQKWKRYTFAFGQNGWKPFFILRIPFCKIKC